MDDMLETMYAAPGIGLAAPQVGVAQRVIVLDVAGTTRSPRRCAWPIPRSSGSSDETRVYQRGLPVGARALRRRDAAGHGSGCAISTDEQRDRKLEAEGLLATCIQHEMDHLDGVLFVDHLTALKRNIILRKLEKAKNSAP